MDQIDLFLKKLDDVQKLDNLFIKESQIVASKQIKTKMEPPLAKRLGKNTEDAMIQYRLDQSKKGLPTEEPKDIDEEKIDELIVEKYLDQLLDI